MEENKKILNVATSMSAVSYMALCTGTPISILASSRNLNAYGLGSGDLLTASPLETGLLAFCTFIAVITSLVSICITLLYSSNSLSNIRARAFIFSAFTIYWASQELIAGFTFDIFVYQKTYAPMIFFAIIFSVRDENLLGLRGFRNALVFWHLMGLLIIPINPELVLQPNYDGVGYLNERYWGLSAHANNIAPQAFVMLTLLWLLPYKNHWFQILAISVGVIGIILAQSKTTYIAIFISIIFLIFSLIDIRKRSITKFREIVVTNNAIRNISVVLAIFILSYFTVFEFGEDFAEIMTGRNQIWHISIEEFSLSPLFGRGGDAWSPIFAEYFGYLGVASNAHNQTLDILVVGGLFSLFCFAIYLVSILTFPINQKRLGLCFAVLIIFCSARGISEVPFRLGQPVLSDFILHAILIAVLIQSHIVMQYKKT